MLDTAFPVAAKLIEAEAVFLGTVLLEESVPELGPLRGIDGTLEDGVLHPLAIIEADLRHPTQAPPACLVDRGYVVADQYHHGDVSAAPKDGSLPEEGWIAVQIPAQVTGEE